MPKKLKIHPNERVDLVDFNRAANEYTIETSKFGKERVVLDRRSRILEGFRVEIANQTTNPGQFTVFNGNALDRTGRQLNDEDQVNDARTFTLTGANLSFYVEIEYTESDSDSDSRSFWDPTYDNGGAPTPDGREFNLNVSTRTTPTWRIHTPITSGPVGGTPLFDEITNPNSTRIPVAVLSTNGANEIIGVTQVNAASVIESDILAGVTSLRVLNSRLFPAAGTASLGFGSASVEAVTITGNDRTNGILTLAAPTANAHPAGAIVRETGVTARFMQEQTDPTTSVAHSDAQSRLWQGNEIRGAAVQSSKEVYLGRDDLNTRSLKDHIDLIAAQFRELKFGSTTPSVVSLAPPTAFPAAPRYFDRVGSVAGARNATVSIGDGTSSFGDFNGTDETPFAAAVAALPATGGSIHVKAGTYTFANQLSIAKPVQFTGEGAASTRLLSNVGAGTPMILVTGLTADQHLTLEYLSLENTGLSFALFRQDGARTVFQSCNFLGNVDFSASAVRHYVSIDDCVFSNSESGGVALSSSDQLSGTISACEFRVGTAAGTEKCFSGSGDRLTFSGCFFISTGGSYVPVAVDFATASSAVCFEGCTFAANTVIESVASVLTGLSLMGCTFDSSGTPTVPSFNFGRVLNLHVNGLYGETSWSGTSAATPGSVFKFTVDDVYGCVFDTVITTVMTPTEYASCWDFNAVARKRNVVVKDSYAQGFYAAVKATNGSGSLTVRNLLADGNSSNLLQMYGVHLAEEQHLLEEAVEISGLRVMNFNNASTAFGVYVNNSAVGSTNLKVHDCVLTEIGEAVGINAAGILVQDTIGPIHHIDIQNNFISTVLSSATATGISVTTAGAANDNTSISNNSVNNVRGLSGVGVWCDLTTSTQCGVQGNTISEVYGTGAGAADFGVGVYVAGGYGYAITDNVIFEVGNLGGGTAVQSSGIFCGGTWSGKTTVSSNKVDVNAVAHAGILLTPAVASMREVAVSENLVQMSASTLNGVLIDLAGAATDFVGINVSGNQVTGLERANGSGIDVRLQTGAKNINVSNNSVEESVFEVGHTAIQVVGTILAANPPVSISVSGNTVTGDLTSGAPVVRTGYGIRTYYVHQFSIDGNSLNWISNPNTNGSSITVDSGCASGAVVGNVMQVNNAGGGTHDIDMSGAQASFPGPNYAAFIVQSNIAATDAATGGVVGSITPAAGPYAGWVVGTNANF